ncbi:MAG: hypothetical protein FIA95_14750 [Gemmatimonadetes bacterium]|nr:hypothetical protein [Gemmatimonadota bacterium]
MAAALHGGEALTNAGLPSPLSDELAQGPAAGPISDGFLGRLSGSAPGRVILSASGANEPSLESRSLGHGVFTYFLLDGLRGAADADANGAITVPEVYGYVARQVPENTGLRQHPTMSGQLGGEMVLGRAKAR